MADRFKGKEGKELATRILAVMERHDVAPNPRNYTIWSAYVTGSHPGVASAVDDLVRGGSAFDETVAEELYTTYLSAQEPSPRILDASERIANSVLDAQQSLIDVGAMTKDYGEVLETASGRLETAKGGDVKHLVAGLVDETQKMRSRSKELEDRLGEATKEVDALREELNTAREEALTDPLTGLGNRKQLDRALDTMIKDHHENGAPTCVILADIDHFKSINDKWGHPTGDQIIRFVARTLRRMANSSDIVARYGGEEFAALMPHATLEDARAYAERVRQAVEQKQLLRKSTNETLGNVTISLGVAEVTDADTPATALERADQRLYASKQSGRNRVTSDAPEDYPGQNSAAA